MKKSFIGLILIGVLLTSCGRAKIKESIIIDNTLYIKVEGTGDNQEDLQNTLKYIEDKNIKSNDLVIRIYSKDKLKVQYEYENKDTLTLINKVEVSK